MMTEDDKRAILERLLEAQESIQDGLNELERVVSLMKQMKDPQINSVVNRFYHTGFAEISIGTDDESKFVGKSNCSLERFVDLTKTLFGLEIDADTDEDNEE